MDTNASNRYSGETFIRVLKTWQNIRFSSVHGEGCCLHKTLRWQLLSVKVSPCAWSKRGEGASLLISSTALAGCTLGAQLSALLHPASAAARERGLANASELTQSLLCCHKNQHERVEMFVPDSTNLKPPHSKQRHAAAFEPMRKPSGCCGN